jgi:hypothetical protein
MSKMISGLTLFAFIAAAVGPGTCQADWKFWKSKKKTEACPAEDGNNCDCPCEAACYPPISAPLYPSPRQDIPYEVGRTLITNPALYPHELTYSHDYHALYPPYYYCNKGIVSCIPFIPKPRLQGVDVRVKYRSTTGLFGAL